MIMIIYMYCKFFLLFILTIIKNTAAKLWESAYVLVTPRSSLKVEWQDIQVWA